MTSMIDLLKRGTLREKHCGNQKVLARFTFSNLLRAKEYRLVAKIGEGTFSEVWKAQSLKNGTYYACKKMKQQIESIEQVNNLREIQAMRRLSLHPNILQLHEVAYDKKSGSLALICELMDMNIYELIRGRRNLLPEGKIKSYMYQLCKSLDYMHRNGIFHRDVKPENILIKQNLLKLADFGSCRSVFSKQPYTEYISTRWYRAPECLLTDGYYGFKMDIWSTGCVFYEITSLQPLFPGSNEVDQIAKIHEVVGTPNSETLRKFKQTRAMSFDFPQKKGTGISCLIPRTNPESISLMCAMMEYDPEERITAKRALQHPYFRELRLAEKQAATIQRSVKCFEGNENNLSPGVVHNLWRIHKGRKRLQHWHLLDNVQVYPVYKKQDKSNPAIYRPISLLSIISKVMEGVPKVLSSCTCSPITCSTMLILCSTRTTLLLTSLQPWSKQG
ncbi:MAPK/MAK/MRK overlapping kinase-like isoform X3 [Heptranchias perlo]|uniref:MAPK/MAK/MRK overlapping kinase-like isoform X3 n=1 Tax=Heptranchias perlo TaxID=212740 RepID=UPI00355A780B